MNKNLSKACMFLLQGFLFGLNGRFLVEGFGAAKVLGWINWVLCGVNGLFMLAYLLLVLAEYLVAPKGGATVTIKEERDEKLSTCETESEQEKNAGTDSGNDTSTEVNVEGSDDNSKQG